MGLALQPLIGEGELYPFRFCSAFYLLESTSSVLFEVTSVTSLSLIVFVAYPLPIGVVPLQLWRTVFWFNCLLAPHKKLPGIILYPYSGTQKINFKAYVLFLFNRQWIVPPKPDFAFRR